MALVNAMVRRSGGLGGELRPGDSLASSKFITTLATVGAGIWTAAQIASGVLRRIGPTAAFTDTTDSAQNILTVLRGNAPSPQDIVGLSIELYFGNTVAFAHTFAAGRGVIAGVQGGNLNCPASSSKSYLVTIKNDGPEVTVPVVAPGNTILNFVMPPGMSAYSMGPAPGSLNITAGMTVVALNGTPPAAGTVVTGLRYGQGGIIGVVCSAAISATVTSVLFSPTLEFNTMDESV